MRQWERRLWALVTEERLRPLTWLAWPDKNVIRELSKSAN